MAPSDFSRIATNIGAFNALNLLRNINGKLGMHQERLATGQRINSAKDDSAGLTIAGKLNARSEGLKVALKLETTSQSNGTDDNGNTGYNAAPLGSDLGIRSPRFDIASDMLSLYGWAGAREPRGLSDVGLTVENAGSFKLFHESALQNDMQFIQPAVLM